MEDSKRRAYIKQQAAKKKQEGSQPYKGTSPANPSTKRKSSEKTDRFPKKPKVFPEFVMGLKAETKKTVTPIGQGKGKGLMTGLVPVTDKPPVLLCEDSNYALEQLSSIITTDDYEDLSNHVTKAMGETGLFSIAQVTVSVPFLFFFPLPGFYPFFGFQAMLMMKGLISCCLNHETALGCVGTKARSTEDELAELKAWKTVQEKKLALSEQVQGELEKQMEVLWQVLEDKEKKIQTTKDQLRQAKEDATQEYSDSDAYLKELGGIYVNGFDDCFHQVKASFPNLDLSHVTIDAQAQTSVQPVHSKSTDELFADDALIGDLRGDGEIAHVERQIKLVKDSTCQPDEV